MEIADFIRGVLHNSLVVFYVSWWILIPLALFFIFKKLWTFYVIVSYLRSQKYVLLHIKVPEVIEKTPKAMEQVFAAIYAIYSFGLKFSDKYIKGKLNEDSVSFEIIGTSGGVNFQIRVPEQYRNIIESAIYAQYPDAEISEGFDLATELFPKTLPNKVYDLWGTDFHLVKDSAYPIRTYEYFEEAQKEKRLDPIAAITEVMSKLKEGEMLWIQLLVRPTDNSWQKKGAELRDQLIGRKKPAPKGGIIESIGQWIKNLVTAPFGVPEWVTAEEPKPDKSGLLLLSPGEKEVVEAIEEKISKIGFEATIRFVFIDRKDSFSPLNISATMGTFNQFNTANLNSFMPNLETMTLVVGLKSKLLQSLVNSIKPLKKRFVWHRKRQLWESFRKLRWPKKRAVFNIEELATLYHFPSIVVKAPLLRRVPSKKGEPPAGLPIG